MIGPFEHPKLTMFGWDASRPMNKITGIALLDGPCSTLYGLCRF